MTAVHFFHMPIDMAQIILLLLEVFLRLSARSTLTTTIEIGRITRCHQGHLPADGEHHDQNTDHRYHRGDDLGEALVEGLVDCIDIIGDARKNFTLAGAVEILERHAVDLFGNILAEAVGDIRGNIGHDPTLDITEQG